MAARYSELRELIKSTIREVHVGRKKEGRNAQPIEVSARYAREQIPDSTPVTGLPSEPKNPLSDLTELDIYKEVELVCLRMQLAALNEEDQINRKLR